MTEMECFSIESCIRGYQVCKGIWEADIAEELPYRRGNGEVRVSLYRLVSPLVVLITARRAACARGPCGSRALSTGHRYYREL